MCDGVNNLLVNVPELIPMHMIRRLGSTLGHNKFCQSLNSKASTNQTSNSWEPRVIPAIDTVVLHEPFQLALGHDRVYKVQSTMQTKARVGMAAYGDGDGDGYRCIPIIDDVRLADFKGIANPIILLVSIMILRCSHGMGSRPQCCQ